MLAAAVLVVGLLGTAHFYRLQRSAAADTLSTGFIAATDRLHINLEHRLRTFQAAMRGVQGFVLASGGISREQFQTYATSLQVRDLLPGVQAIAFVEPLLPDQLPEHLARQRLAFSGDYQILPPGERNRYAPITYIEPLADNLDALGFDTLTNQAARVAMELSLTRGDIAITSRLMLVQDAGTNEVYSFVMYLPVFRPRVPLNTLAAREAALLGWVDVPFRMNDLMAGLEGEFSPDIYLEIHDGVPGTDTRMYYTRNIDNDDPGGNLEVQRTLPVAGREWTLVMRSTPSFEAALVNPMQGPLTLLSGGALSLAFSLVMWLLANARYSAEFRYRRLFDNAGDGIVVFDRNFSIAAANPTALRLLGYGWEELKRLRLSDLVDGTQWPALADAVHGLRQGDTHQGEWSHRDKIGYVFPAQVSISMLEGERYFSILRDMTQHRKAQERFHRLSQFYKALSATNHAILRRGDAAELFQEVCRIAVDYGGMTMAWVGQLDQDSQWIHPVASAGRGLSYLEKLSVSANTALPEGRGPTGVALRENRSVCINDYLSDPTTLPWQGLARQYGWQSTGTFPINRGGRPHAVLTVYHSHTDAFDSEAIALLEEMASDISFALDNHDKELERERSEVALVESEGRLSAIIENIGASIYMKDTEGRYLFVNQPVLDLWGVSRDQVIGNSDASFFDEATVARIRDNDLRVLRDGEIVQAEESNRVRGGEEVITYWSVKLPLRRTDGSIYALCGISTDISERKRLEEVQRLNARVFETSEEGIVITDAANNIVSVNRAWCEITGYEASEVLGRNPRMLASGQHGKQFYQNMWQEVAGQGHWQGELINRRKNGDYYPQWLSITVIRDDGGRITNHIGIVSDLSEHKAREERIEFLSNYDPLTLLPNRALLRDRAELALAGARRSKDHVALLYIDLDRFKIVNESLGHSVGDELLKEFSGRLRSQLQADQTLCRQGGDDFILLLPDTDAEAAAHVASMVLESCAQPVFVGKQRLVLTTCIGIAVFPEDGQDYEQLTRAADAALFRAKKTGPGSFQFFTPQMHEHASEVLQLEGELRQAIERKQLLLHYQPQFDLASGELVGAEALVRWQHPDNGLVSPARFIPLAEESGLIIDIGTWVLREAIRQNRSWQIEGLPVVPIAVNLSALQFRQSGFYAQVVSALDESGLPPGLLELELTEGIAMEDTEYTVNMLAQLHGHGLALAIDDFGMGYSSLSYLKRYTIDTLKIDQSFVQGLGTQSGDEEIVNAIIGMARSLGFKTLAEGVETQEQLQYLRQHQCDQVQGFLCSRPLAAADFESLLRRGGRIQLLESQAS